MEIYNEIIRDLLSELPTEKGLELREDAHHGISVIGITEAIATSPKEVLELLHFGSA
jgi:hypothetical protein